MNLKNVSKTPVEKKNNEKCRKSIRDFLFRSEKQLSDKETLLATKTAEINSMEERYVQYLEKAKMVLRQMDPRNSNSISNQEIQSLKKQLEEKDRRYKDLEVSRKSWKVERRKNHFLSFCQQKEFEKMKTIRDDQEKLLISAWYSLVKSKQKENVDSVREKKTKLFLLLFREAHFNVESSKND